MNCIFVSSSTFQALSGLGGKLKFNLHRSSSQNATLFNSNSMMAEAPLEYVNMKMWESKQPGNHKHLKLRGKQALRHYSPGEASTFFLFSLSSYFSPVAFRQSRHASLSQCAALRSFPFSYSLFCPHTEVFMYLFSNNILSTNLFFLLNICAKELFIGVIWSAVWYLRHFVLLCSQLVFSLNSLRWSETIQLAAAPLEAISPFSSFPLSARLKRLLVSLCVAELALKENIKLA